MGPDRAHQRRRGRLRTGCACRGAHRRPPRRARLRGTRSSAEIESSQLRSESPAPEDAGLFGGRDDTSQFELAVIPRILRSARVSQLEYSCCIGGVDGVIVALGCRNARHDRSSRGSSMFGAHSVVRARAQRFGDRSARRHTAIAGVLAISLVAAACGSDDNASVSRHRET